MTYYLYVDDSNKFEKKDEFVLYSYILLTKKERTSFQKEYLKIWNKVVNESKPYDLENSQMPLDDILCKPLREIKGDEFIEKFNRSLRYNSPDLADMNQFIGLYKNFQTIGTIVWCKNCSTNKDWNSHDMIINKKKYMILLIVKKLLDESFIKENDELCIYLDHEFSNDSDVRIGELFREYLNTPINNHEMQNGTNKMLYKLRMHNIRVRKFEFLDSNLSPAIRCADILANLSNKIWKNKCPSWVKEPNNVLDKLKSFGCEINWLIFPNIRYNNNVDIVRCNHRISE